MKVNGLYNTEKSVNSVEMLHLKTTKELFKLLEEAEDLHTTHQILSADFQVRFAEIQLEIVRRAQEEVHVRARVEKDAGESKTLKRSGMVAEFGNTKDEDGNYDYRRVDSSVWKSSCACSYCHCAYRRRSVNGNRVVCVRCARTLFPDHNEPGKDFNESVKEYEAYRKKHVTTTGTVHYGDENDEVEDCCGEESVSIEPQTYAMCMRCKTVREEFPGCGFCRHCDFARRNINIQPDQFGGKCVNCNIKINLKTLRCRPCYIKEFPEYSKFSPMCNDDIVPCENKVEVQNGLCVDCNCRIMAGIVRCMDCYEKTAGDGKVCRRCRRTYEGDGCYMCTDQQLSNYDDAAGVAS